MTTKKQKKKANKSKQKEANKQTKIKTNFSVANGECMFKYNHIGKNLVAFATNLVDMYSPDSNSSLFFLHHPSQVKKRGN